MRGRGLAASVALLGVALPSSARATASTSYAETSRVASLADAVSARPGDAGSMFMNPAGLGDISSPEVVLNGSYDRLSEWFARTNESRQGLGRAFGSFGFAAAAPLPGPWWLRRVKVGVALDVPASYILQVDIPERVDQPTSPTYDVGPNRISAIGALAVDLLPQLKIGGGVNVTPSITTPTTVAFVPGYSNTIQNDVVSNLDREAPLAATPFIGVRAQPLPYLGLAVVYRGPSVSHAGGPETLTAGPITESALVDYLIFWSPEQLVGGIAVGPWRDVSLSLDATVSDWSAFRGGFDQQVNPAFHDTLSVMAGVEWQASRWLTLRGGGGYEPSPIPAQSGDTNYLGAGTTVLALGGGVDLRRLVRVPIRIDAHVRGRIGAEQTATKDAASLTDADPTTHGQQVDNLGYPGFSSRSTLYQAGLSLTFFIGKEAR